MIDLEQIKRQDEEMVDTLEANRDKIERDPRAFREKVVKLLWVMTQVAEKSTNVDDVAWLQSAATRWKKTASSSLGGPLPQSLRVPIPHNISTPRPEKFWQKDNLVGWLEYKAREIFGRRAISRYCGKSEDEIVAEIQQGDEERERDWHAARIYLACDVLDGKLDFVRDFGTESYQLLEGDCWLRDVKQVKAYLRWHQRAGYWGEEAARTDYIETCKEIQDRATDPTVKASHSAFEVVSAYLESKYLERVNHDTWIVKHGAMDNLIETRAYRVSELTGRTSTESWDEAEAYVREFYSCILPAVACEDDNAISKIIELLQLGKATNRVELANCFEAAIAIYFLNAAKVASLLKSQKVVAIAA